MAAAVEDVPVPPQYQPQPLYDLRQFPDVARGYKVGVTKYGKIGTKRKLDEYAEQVEREQAEMQEGDAAEVVVQDAPKRTKHNALGVGKASGRAWKQPGERAGSLKNPKLTTSWDKKMSDKAEAAAFKERKRAAEEARKAAAAEARRKREAAKQRKEEAQKRSEVVTRVNSATAKRMMKHKKQRKLLRSGDAS